MHKIVTISREFGSGGRELGKRLAEELGIPCYDHQIIEMIAKENGFDERYVANVSEKSIEAAYPMTIGHRFAMPSMEIMEQPIRVAAAQRQIIENFAKQGDCVIIGRCADYVLDGTEGLIRVFLYADIKVREERVRERNLYADKDVLKNIHRIDRERRDYNRYYAGRDWEKPENYDLLINTTQIGVDGAVQLIKDYLKMRGLL